MSKSNSDELEKLLPKCKAKDTDDFPELIHEDESARCWNCRVWEAIEAHTATKVREARIDELTSLQHYGSPTQSFVKYSEIEQRLRQLTNKEIT